MQANTLRTLTCSTVFLGLVGCADFLMPSENTMPDAEDGAAFFSENCTACHGSTGKGDGPLVAQLPVAPTDLTTLSRQNGGTFPTARALSYIYGDPEEGHLARVMPEFADSLSDDLVPLEVDGILTPTPRTLAGLLFYLESIQVP